MQSVILFDLINIFFLIYDYLINLWTTQNIL